MSDDGRQRQVRPPTPGGDPLPVPARDVTPAAPPGGEASSAGVETVRHARLNALWGTIAVTALVAAVLLVFVAQNNQPVDIGFFGARGQVPLGVALLLAAIGGALLVVVISSGRVLWQRRALRRREAAPARPATAPGRPAESAGDTESAGPAGAAGPAAAARPPGDDTRPAVDEDGAETPRE
jgi:uncharacterized integral membrane protein